MKKRLIITEKPSVAMEILKALKINGKRGDGFIEGDDTIITWCVGHLVSLSYPEVYDEKLKKWQFETLPFLPETWKYEVRKDVKKQFAVVKKHMTRADVDTIYCATDSALEGENIFRLVLEMCGSKAKSKKLLRIWIDSQTEEEIQRGVREAKPLSEYDNLAKAALLRSKEDYLMGINFSRAIALRYQSAIKSTLMADKSPTVAVGRVMTCVLGMVVEREEQVRKFVKTSFYKVQGESDAMKFEWSTTKDSAYFESPLLYNEKGFLKEIDAITLKNSLSNEVIVTDINKKTEVKNPPLLYNLAEIQGQATKDLKLSPDETLAAVQILYEKKMVTYPRTDARVLSTAVAKEIDKNLNGLTGYAGTSKITSYILGNKKYDGLTKTKYVDDSKISDHYAIIPTGKGLDQLSSLTPVQITIYDMIVRRFLAIFLPGAKYEKIKIEVKSNKESLFLDKKILAYSGFLGLYDKEVDDQTEYKTLSLLKKGDTLTIDQYNVTTGETKPPSRYTSGSMVLAMENAGKLIEDEELREQIKGSGIGTSATRAETIKKLVKNAYLSLDKKTQILKPTKLGYAIYDSVLQSIPAMLKPDHTASWEKGLDMVVNGTLTEDAFYQKLTAHVATKTNILKEMNAAVKINIPA